MAWLRLLLCFALVGSARFAGDAAADTKPSNTHDQALARLEAAYQTTAKASPGADRTRQACADAAAIQTAGAQIPKRAPTGAAIDDSLWDDMAVKVKSQLEDLVAVCKAPDHKLQLGAKAFTADGVAASVDEQLRGLLDAAKPRDLPPALKKFQTTAVAMRPTGKQLCTQHKALVKLLPQLATAPDRADAAKWQAVHASLTESLEELKQFGCGAHRHAAEEIAGSLQSIHDDYSKLVLLVPSRAGS